MKIKYADIYQTLANEENIRNIKLPIRYALAVAKGINECKRAWQDFEDVRKKLMDEYGFRELAGLEGEEYEKQKAHNESVLEELNRKVNEALREETDINLTPIKLELKDSEGQDVDIRTIEPIIWMFE